METDYSLHFKLFFSSIINGLLLGFIYDIFRVSRMFFLKNRTLLFFEDLLYCFVCALSFTLLFYNFSFGQMRAYAFLGSIGGFCAYYFTIGRFTKIICEKVYAFLSPKILYIKNKIKAVSYMLKKCLFTDIMSRSYCRKAAKGFGLLKIGGS